jgi:hypothetical protein
MAIKGTNSNGNEGAILSTFDGELKVRAIAETEFEHAAGTGEAWCWQNADADIDVGDTTICVRNDSEKFLIWDRAIISPANVVAEYDFGIGELTTTMAGTVITARPTNGEFLGRTASALSTAYGDETALADADLIFTAWCPITQSVTFALDGLVCVKGQYLQVNCEIETTSARIALFGHFADEIG